MSPVRDMSRLASDARDGDRSALEQFVRAIQTDVWRYCVHLIGRADADDVAQDALMRIIAKLHRWQQGPIKPWALGVTRNVCLEHRRRRSHRRKDHTDHEAAHRLAAPDQLGALEIVQMLSALPFEMREALVLTHIIGFSYAEAADVAQCAIGTIRSRVARARDAIAEAVESARQHGT